MQTASQRLLDSYEKVWEGLGESINNLNVIYLVEIRLLSRGWKMLWKVQIIYRKPLTWSSSKNLNDESNFLNDCI